MYWYLYVCDLVCLRRMDVEKGESTKHYQEGIQCEDVCVCSGIYMYVMWCVNFPSEKDMTCINNCQQDSNIRTKSLGPDSKTVIVEGLFNLFSHKVKDCFHHEVFIITNTICVSYQRQLCGYVTENKKIPKNIFQSSKRPNSKQGCQSATKL